MDELNPLGSLANQTSAIQTINENYDIIEEGINDKLSLTEGGAMQVPLDMNGRPVVNVGAPTSSTDVARWVDVQNALTPEGVTIPGLATNAGKFLQTDGMTLKWTSITGDYVTKANNGSDFADVATVRVNLGLGTVATRNVGTTGIDIPALDGLDNQWTGTNTFQASFGLTGGAFFGGTADYYINNNPTALDPKSIGFRGIPPTSQDGNYQFVLNDSGQCRYHTSGVSHTYTIPNDATVNYPPGTVLVVDNVGAGAVVIARGAGVVLRREGSGTDTNFNLAQWGSAYIRKRATNSWVVSGSNLS